MAALVFILPVGYLGYCVATLPHNGGLVIEPTPSALVVERHGGQLFATRGVFKGAKLVGRRLPVELARAVVAIEDRQFL